MRSLALLLSYFGLAIAISCQDGFTDPDNTGNCYLFGFGTLSHSYAQKMCARRNATLPKILKAEDGVVLQKEVLNGNVWLGLNCQTSDPLSCVWDDGTPLRKGDYQNFAPGHPKPTYGSCVFMDNEYGQNKSGQWLSSSCDTVGTTMCERVNGLAYSLCSDGSRYFNGNCYFGMIAYNVHDGISMCNAASGDLASIHSDSENLIVLSVAKLLEPSDFTYLGLQFSSSAYKWSDGTAVDYRNFGTENTKNGPCVQMSLIDGGVPSGKWVNSQCGPYNLTISSTPVNTICKRSVDKTPVVSTGASPDKCSSTIFLNGMGQIQSPGYPNSDANNCKYLVTENATELASVTFTQLSLDANSKISFFNNLFDKTPFATITAIKTNETKTYVGTGNSLTMTFTTNGGSGNSFRGIFGAAQYSCVDDYYYDSGVITQPHCPDYYPVNLESDCQYLLFSAKNRIALRFKKFDIGRNVVSIYDGTGPLLTTITGAQDNFAISSFSNSMRIVFETKHLLEDHGFEGEFVSIL